MSHAVFSSDGAKAWASRPQRKVALLLETSNAHARTLLQGIFAYVRAHNSWAFSLVEQGNANEPPAWVADWDGDGIIARIKNRKIAETVLASGLPVVDLSIGRFLPSVPAVEPDDGAIASLAAEHFLQRGFRNFGYCGDDAFMISARRGAAFAEVISKSGFDCAGFQPRMARTVSISQRVNEIAEWLKELPKPVAIFACNDVRGQHVLEACRFARLVVPEEVAVLGVDDDELLCEMAVPPMSSVIPNARRTGYEAARLLDLMMAGKKVPPDEFPIEPLGITLRQSTDVLAVDDVHIAMALRFIREHVSEPITPKDVACAVPVPRRTLEKRFRKLLSRSLHEEILAVRMGRVKQLLTETKLSLEQIAVTMNYEHPEYLSVVFKREVGLTPREFRARHEHSAKS